MTPKTCLKVLRAELRYHQMLNRLAVADYRAGTRKIKELAAEMRALAAQMRN
jgi:hypothetical protein